MSKEIKDKKFGRQYLTAFKKQVVEEVEKSGNLMLICERHELSPSTTQTWMRRYGSDSFLENRRKKRDLSQRSGIAREIVSGHLSIEEALLKYDIESRDTITKWVREYKKNQNNMVESLPQEPVTTKNEEISGDLAELKLAELKIRALEIMLDIASKEFNVDIRKKFGAKR